MLETEGYDLSFRREYLSELKTGILLETISEEKPPRMSQTLMSQQGESLTLVSQRTHVVSWVTWVTCVTMRLIHFCMH